MSLSSGSGRAVEILLVEDSPTDAGLTRQALKAAELFHNLRIAEDGEEAMAYLRQEGRYADAPRPDLILLDLNLPRKNGREVLAEIRSDPLLKGLVVVVLTTSKDEQDVVTAYHLNTNAYITKPVNLDDFLSVVKSIHHFWFSVVTLPPNEPSAASSD